MDMTSQLDKLQVTITDIIDQLKDNCNVNVACDEIRNALTELAETILRPVIEEIICSPVILPVLKIGAGKLGLRFNGYRTTSIMLLSGEAITIRSPYFAKARPKKRKGRKPKKRKNGTGAHFGLDFLGFVGRCTILLGSAVVQAALLCPSYELARKTLLSHAIKLDVKTIRRLVMSLGKRAIEHRGRLSLSENDTVHGKTILICIDGGRLRERTAKRGRKCKGQKRQGFHSNWREPLQFVIQTINEEGVACKDHLPIYDATMGKIDFAFDLLEECLGNMNISNADHVIFCGDGARSYWKRIEPMMKRLGVVDHHEVIDYTHAKQNLNEIIGMLPKKLTSKEVSKITEEWKNLLWQGNVDEIKVQIKKQISYPKKREKALAKFENYFNRNRERVQYASMQEQNLPIGSGCVESAIRRVVNLRMKSPGIFWKKETAEHMLFLRSQLLSGRWNIMISNMHKETRRLSVCN
jgi:hypothetical protein